MCARLSFDRYYALRVFVWGVLWSTSLYTRVRRLSFWEGFSLFQLDKKKNGTRIPIAHTTHYYVVVKNTRRGLSPFCKRKPSATPKHVKVQSVKDEDVQKQRVIIMAFYRKNQIQKKDLLYNMFRVCKRGSLLLLFFCASVRLSLIRTPFFSSPPLFRPRRVEASSP